MSDVANTVDTAETPAHLKNDKRYAEALKTIRKFGAESAGGRDALPKLAMYVVKLAADGVIDAETKNAKGDDSAKVLYAAYVEAESSKSIHDHSGTRANESKLRQLIKVGCMTGIDANQLMQDAFDARERMIAEEQKVKPAYPFYVEVARDQLGKPTEQLDGDYLEGIALKDGPKEKTVEGEIKRAMKILENLISGEGKAPKDTDELTDAAFQALRDRAYKFEQVRQIAKMHEAAAKAGITLTF